MPVIYMKNSTDVNVGFHLFSTDVRLFRTSLEGPSGDFFLFLLNLASEASRITTDINNRPF